MLQIPILLWLRLVRDIRRRGQGHRESGAFLLGKRGESGDMTKAYVCYDDLDPRCLDSGIVDFTAVGFAALWTRCRELDLEVLADVHTHSNERPRQSETDRLNPMLPEIGHMAFILPRFAGTWGWRFRNVAVYEYKGNYKWHDWGGPRRRDRVRHCLW